MPGVKTYNSKLVMVAVNGVLMTGLGEGDFCTVTPATDIASKKVGADGETMRSVNPDGSGSIVIRVQQTSLANVTLQALARSKAVFFFAVDDIGGTSIFSTAQAWMATQAEMGFAAEGSEREWRIDFGVGNYNQGYNL